MSNTPMLRQIGFSHTLREYGEALYNNPAEMQIESPAKKMTWVYDKIVAKQALSRWVARPSTA